MGNTLEISLVFIGTWDMKHAELIFNEKIIQWDTEQNIAPMSICAIDCLDRQIKIQLEPKCCWECR